MQVILLEDVENVGRAGHIVEVADGYARNVLFPRGQAAAATKARVQEAAASEARAARTSERDLATMQELVQRADRKTVVIRTPAGPQGKLHGAVTAKDIAEEIASALGISLPPGTVRLAEPIREPGEHKVALEFPHGLEAEVTVVLEANTPPEPGT